MNVRSEMAATIRQVLVAEGARVAAGEEILILESMKMEIPVESPADGIITKMYACEGATVDEGEILLCLD